MPGNSIQLENVERAILTLRGKRVIMDSDLAARVTKLLAEAEKEKSIAAKTRAEADALEFATIVRKLRLLLEAQRAMVHGHLNGFLGVLRDMGTS